MESSFGGPAAPPKKTKTFLPTLKTVCSQGWSSQAPGNVPAYAISWFSTSLPFSRPMLDPLSETLADIHLAAARLGHLVEGHRLDGLADAPDVPFRIGDHART